MGAAVLDSDDEERATFESHMHFGDLDLRASSLTNAELLYAKALKLASRLKNSAFQSRATQRLGDVFLQHKEYGKATALYNYSLHCARITPDKDLVEALIHRIKFTEKSFLNNAKGGYVSVSPSPYELDLQHQRMLRNLRRDVNAILQETILTHKENIRAANGDSAQIEALELQRAEAIHQLYQFIGQEMRDFIKVLLQECFAALGPPPCEYSVLGLGSLARGEMTPYSDFEWALLIEDKSEKINSQNKVYFRKLAQLLHIKVINLGETILPSMAIKSLNYFHANDPLANWFYDDVIPRGFAFDGLMPWASKTPLARQATAASPSETELIATPKDLANFLMDEIDLKEGYHLAEVLAATTLVGGNESLYQTYRNIADNYLKRDRVYG